MILNYKICKYNLDEDYQNDWTSIWNFSHSFGHSFSLSSEYLDMEKKYLNVAIEFLKIFHDGSLIIEEIEDNRTAETRSEFFPIDPHLMGSLDQELYKLKGCSVSFIDAIYLLQLSLREIIWIKFLHPSGAYFSFGHDYYWLVGVGDNFDVSFLTKNQGLFIYDNHYPWD